MAVVRATRRYILSSWSISALLTAWTCRYPEYYHRDRRVLGHSKLPTQHWYLVLTPEESEMAQYRMVVSSGGHSEDDEGGAWEGVSLAIRDPYTWIFAILHSGLILALSFKDFFPSVSLQDSCWMRDDADWP